MMNLFDIYKLAQTKLKSHKVRTAITVIIAGLLFGILVALIIVMQGIFSSVDNYSNVGLNNRTLIAVNYSPQNSSFDEYRHLDDPQFIKEAETIYSLEVTRLQSIAKKYNVEYDVATANPSPFGIDPITKQKIITMSGVVSESVQKAAEVRRESSRKQFSINDYISPYRSATLRGNLNAIQPQNGFLTFMKQGKENQMVSSNQMEDGLIGSGTGATLNLLDASVSRPFIVDKTFDTSKGELPVIIPFSATEKLLDLPSLGKDATQAERKDRLAYVRAHVRDITSSFCYRNEASRLLLGEAVAQQDELKKSAANSGRIQSKVLYNTPNDSDCSAITIKSDMRTAEDKLSDADKVLFEKEAGLWPGEPSQHKINVRGIGIAGDTDSASSTLSIDNFVSSLLTSSLNYNSWSIPRDLFDRLPASSKPTEVFDGIGKSSSGNTSLAYESYLVEFNDKTDARKLLERTGAFTGAHGDVTSYQFGSNTLFVDETRAWIKNLLSIILLIVGGIAVVILWSIIARTISDSRRESAIFRAIGAQRIDIASVYGCYALLLSLLVVIFAFVFGITVASVIHLLFSEKATLSAQLAYAATDESLRFSLFDLSSGYIWIVVIVIFGAGLIASILPIVNASRRNPIDDMRDEG